MRILLLLLFPFISFSQNVLYYESAEGTTLFASKLSGITATKQTTTVYGITLSKDKHYAGYQSARFELRDTDPMNNSGTRAEITFPTTTNLNRWYSYALLFDSANYKKDASDEVITQWHQGGGKTPALCLRTKNDRLYLRIMGSIWVDLGLLDKGKWHAYVMHVKHSSGSDGLVEIWRDGVKILSRTGQNMYRVTGDLKNPNLKLGIYKSAWNNSQTTATNKRVLYFDEIKIGNEKATLKEMAPAR
jgi:hypothetical protein